MSLLVGEGPCCQDDIAPLQHPDAVGVQSGVGGRLWAGTG